MCVMDEENTSGFCRTNFAGRFCNISLFYNGNFLFGKEVRAREINYSLINKMFFGTGYTY